MLVNHFDELCSGGWSLHGDPSKEVRIVVSVN